MRKWGDLNCNGRSLTDLFRDQLLSSDRWFEVCRWSPVFMQSVVTTSPGLDH